MRFTVSSAFEILIALVVGGVLPWLTFQVLSDSLPDRIGGGVLTAFLLIVAFGLVRDAFRGGHWLTSKNDE